MQTATQTYSEPKTDAKSDTATMDKRQDFGQSPPLERDEARNLISSDSVQGTQIFATDGEKIGHIDRVMLGKRSGRVEYVIMSFGGFLGIGESYSALPWDALDYDTERGGYVINIERDRLKDAPRFDRNSEPEWNRAYGERIYAYHGVMY